MTVAPLSKHDTYRHKLVKKYIKVEIPDYTRWTKLASYTKYMIEPIRHIKNLLSLPNELLVMIQGHLSVKDRSLVSWAKTCRRMHMLSDHELASRQLLVAHRNIHYKHKLALPDIPTFEQQLGSLETNTIPLNTALNTSSNRVLTTRPSSFVPNNNPSPVPLPARYAKLSEATAIITRCLERRARVNIYNTKGNTALFFAALTGNLASTKLLLQSGAQVNPHRASPPLGHEYTTPLVAAVEKRHIEVARALLEAGANPEASSCPHLCRLVLRTTISYNDLEMAKLLLEYGADPNRQATKRGGVIGVPLLQATPNMARLLIAFGANVNLRSRLGDSPLWFIKYRSVHHSRQHVEQLVEILKEHGAEEISWLDDLYNAEVEAMNKEYGDTGTV